MRDVTFRKFSVRLRNADYRALFICVLIILVGVGGMVRSFYKSTTTTLPADGGSYIEGAVGRVSILNPVYCSVSNVDQDLCSLLFSGLTRFDPETNEVWGDIAYRWDVQSDGTVYTFHLRNNVLWHDGVPLTADDVIFTYRDILQSPLYDGGLKDTFRDTQIEKVDDHTVVFTLKKENAFFPGFVTVGLLPQHILKDIPAASLQFAPYNHRPIGSGMYTIDDWITNEDFDQIELAAFERFYRDKPHIKQLTYYAFSSFAHLERKIGALTGIRQISPSELPEIKKDDNFDLHELLLNRYVGVIFNTARPILKSIEVRRGLRYAVNNDALTAAVPSIELINSPVPHFSTGANEFDLERAKEYLFAGGWKIFSDTYDDGFRRNGAKEKMELTLVTTKDETLQKVADVLKQSWKDAGIDLKIVTLEIGDLEKEYLPSRNYDMLLIGQNLGSDIDLYSFWHSSQVDHPGLNLANYKSPQVDLMIEKVRETHDYREQVELTKQLIGKINDDIPALFLYTPFHVYATKKNAVHIFIAQNIGHVSDRFALLYKWYIDEKRIWKE